MSTKLNSDLLTGSVVQSQITYYTTYTGVSADITKDDTIPESSEGTELCTVSITPKSSSNILRVALSVIGASSAANWVVAWALRDAGTYAICTGGIVPPGTNYMQIVTAGIDVVAGSTAATIFKLRVSSAATFYVNGNTSSRLFGGTLKTFIRVDEIAA